MCVCVLCHNPQSCRSVSPLSVPLLSVCVYTVARSQKESYQCDAISSMVQLNESHFEQMHTFRLEWQPGDDGYIRWYMDDEFRFGIDAAGLAEQQNAHIPNEPSYVILNTAISTSWGFPNPPPGCTEYDCKDPAKQCGMNPGWCKTLPAEFKIDYVRIYQDTSDTRQTIGCNPREYPTKRFIKAHEFRYKGLDEKEALMVVKTGGGECRTDNDCGGIMNGHCQYSIWQFYANEGFQGCVCKEDWQGPQCLVPTYQNPFPDWDVEPTISWVSPYIPHFLAFWVSMCIIAMVTTLWFAWRWRQQKRAHVTAATSAAMVEMEPSMTMAAMNPLAYLRSTTTPSSGGYQPIPTTEMTSLRAASASDSNEPPSHHHTTHAEYNAASTHHPKQTLYQAL